MTQKFDVCIRGDGMVGRSLALLLARQRLRVALVQSPTRKHEDVRAYSLNSASRSLLTDLRCWPDETHATPVQHMRVWGDDGGFISFDSASPEGLTWMVDVPVLEAQLAQAVRYQAEITLLDHAAAADLTVICEGRYSVSRDELGVSFDTLPYQQTAVAARLQCSAPHLGQAFQWFSQGAQGLEILALLPMGGAQGSEVAMVWSLPPQRASDMLAASPEDFAQAVALASHQSLGKLNLTTQRAAWPLQLARAEQWTGRFAVGSAWALAGDAAHNIHPLAGLGLNLGLADVAELAQVLASRQGADYWRSTGDRLFLRRYERARKADMLPTWLACDGLQRLFDHPNTSLQWLRNWGMKGFNAAPQLKRWTMQQAMR